MYLNFVDLGAQFYNVFVALFKLQVTLGVLRLALGTNTHNMTMTKINTNAHNIAFGKIDTNARNMTIDKIKTNAHNMTIGKINTNKTNSHNMTMT